ncbi:MAG: phosphoribosylaminoimidazolesuccinocarboxamide synthase [Calditrichia bacterium]
MNPAPLLNSSIPGATLLNRGKVRDIYDAGDHLVIVTSDRISAFDVVMAQGIPAKGIVLTQISKFWFSQSTDLVKNHFVTDDVASFPEPFCNHVDMLKGRAMLVHKAKPLPAECIVRGYLAGSGWKEYRKSGTLHKMELPTGLQESSRLPKTVFTPSTKAEEGHDENITFDEMCELIDRPISEKVRDLSLKIYNRAADAALTKGIIIADTKFEFGMLGDEIILIDEALTPDSSRFWPQDTYETGRSQASLDKQYLRDYLETLDWDKTPPPPTLPEEVVMNTSKKYQEILQILTGKTIEDVLK